MICFILKFLISSFGIHTSYGKPLSSFDLSLREDLKKRISKATWSQYPKLFKLILGKDFTSIAKENRESMNFLFQFRNSIGHGEPFDISYRIQYIEGQEKIFKPKIHNKPDLYNYLIKNNKQKQP